MMEKDKKQLNETTGLITDWVAIDTIAVQKGQDAIIDFKQLKAHVKDGMKIVGELGNSGRGATSVIKKIEFVMTTASGSRYTLDLRDEATEKAEQESAIQLLKQVEKEWQDEQKNKKTNESQNMQKNRLLELAGVLSEAAEYSDSSEFTADYESVQDMIDKIGKIITTKKWENWMKVTEQNYGVKTIQSSGKLKADWTSLKFQFGFLDDQMNKADGK